MKIFYLTIRFLSFFILIPIASHAFNLDDLDSSQLVVVITPDWNSVTAEVKRFEKKEGKWVLVGTVNPAVVGKNGLGWGDGLQPSLTVGGLFIFKKEGDGKAPAGIFYLTDVYGYGVSLTNESEMPYHPIQATTECVDDINSSAYNLIVDSSLKATGVTWQSSEKMLRQDSLYKWLVVVNYNNTPKPVPGKGSCIFFHVWRNPIKGTAGCTATSEEKLLELIAWLDPSKKPILIQLPKAEYQQYQAEWGLPLF